MRVWSCLLHTSRRPGLILLTQTTHGLSTEHGSRQPGNSGKIRPQCFTNFPFPQIEEKKRKSSPLCAAGSGGAGAATAAEVTAGAAAARGLLAEGYRLKI